MWQANIAGTSIPTCGCVFVQKGGGGALAVVTVRTLSQQLGGSVFTKTKRALIGWDFFMDGWFQFTVKLRDEKNKENKSDSSLD